MPGRWIVRACDRTIVHLGPFQDPLGLAGQFTLDGDHLAGAWWLEEKVVQVDQRLQSLDRRWIVIYP